MTTHLTSWSKMSFQKKSKATASVGSPSARSLLRSKSSRGTKSEVKVDRDNNNSQESLEQEAEERRDMESKSPLIGRAEGWRMGGCRGGIALWELLLLMNALG